MPPSGMHFPHHHAETNTTITPGSVAMVRRSCDRAVDQVHVARFPVHPFGCEPLRKILAARQNHDAAARDRIDPNRVTDRRIVLTLRAVRRTKKTRGQGFALVTHNGALIGRPSAKIPKRPNSTIAGGSERRTTGDDCNRYLQRKSQIFGDDPASGAG